MFLESGKVFVWGSNSEGQLGFESSKTNCKQPTLLEFKDKIRDISCGYYHTAVITGNFMSNYVLLLLTIKNNNETMLVS